MSYENDPKHVGTPHTDGHGHTHHVLGKEMLIRVFGGLIFLTLLTVVLGLMERHGVIHLGSMSVPVALAIAGVKAYLVAAFFMGLREDGGSNALAFVSSLAFLLVFVSFTYLDTGFRDVVKGTGVASPIDVQDRAFSADSARQAAIQSSFEAQPILGQPDTLLLPGAVDASTY